MYIEEIMKMAFMEIQKLASFKDIQIQISFF